MEMLLLFPFYVNSPVTETVLFTLERCKEVLFALERYKEVLFTLESYEEVLSHWNAIK
jgi:hypothetical protein